MFGFNKKKKTEKKQGVIEKILMGVVLGGAIGSVLGVGLAPKKGSDTRKDLAKKAGEILDGAKDSFQDAKYIVQGAISDVKEAVSPSQPESPASKVTPTTPAKKSSKSIPEQS